MISYCGDVKAFHDKFELVTPPQFQFVSEHLFDFRLRFFQEEIKEYEKAYNNQDLGEAIDALIDLVYITCGCALLHGISVQEFEHLVDNNSIKPEQLIVNVAENLPILEEAGAIGSEGGKLRLIATVNNQKFMHVLNSNLEQFVDARFRKDETALKNSLIALYLNSLYGSYLMGFSNDQWDEMWSDVQRANISKVRATSASQSKRGSSFDVVKPVGWVGPRTEELVQKFLAAEEA